MNQRILAITLLAAVTTSVAAGLYAFGILPGSRTISNEGTLKAIGVSIYWESSCQTNVTSINWGLVEPGSSQNVHVWIRNEGNVPVTLTMTKSNWSPSAASTFMTVSWNRNNYVLGSGNTVEAIISLVVDADVVDITDFSFDITIIGTE